MSDNRDNVFTIKRIELAPFTNNELRRYSVARKSDLGLNVPETVTKGEPTIGGVSDPRLGSTNASRDCNTCGQDSDGCECHMGHITLPVPMYNPVYIAKTRKMLACMCLECSRIPIEPGSTAFKKFSNFQTVQSRIEEIKRAVNTVKVCPFCKAQIPNIRKDSKEKKDKNRKDKRCAHYQCAKVTEYFT
jgi:DNA-directed RNA polymerase beta' subunit